MTKDDVIRMADLVGYDVDDDDDVYAPASGRYGLDPRLEHFAQLVAEHTLQYKCRNVYTKSQNSDTSAECVHESDIRKAAQMALESLMAWEEQAPQYWDGFDMKAVEALRQALAQPEQEPVAYMTYKGYLYHASDPKVLEHSDPTPLYATPPSTSGYAKKIESLIKERDELRQQLADQKLADAFAEDFPNTWGKKKHTAPPSKPWVSLTDEEIDYIWGISHGDYEDKFAFPRAIEAKLKEKNT